MIAKTAFFISKKTFGLSSPLLWRRRKKVQPTKEQSPKNARVQPCRVQRNRILYTTPVIYCLYQAVDIYIYLVINEKKYKSLVICCSLVPLSSQPGEDSGFVCKNVTLSEDHAPLFCLKKRKPVYSTVH